MQKGMLLLVMMAVVLPATSETGADVSEQSPPQSAASPIMARSILLGLHRGGRNEWPENTVPAFEEGARRWPDALLEMDVHATADGHVVVIHDDTVDRTTDGTGLVRLMTLEEIKRLDAAYRFTTDSGVTYPYRGKGITIPTLEEVLAVSSTHRFLIEMKDGDTIAAATVAAIRNANAADRCILAAVPPAFVEEARAVAPEIMTCYDFISAATMLSDLRYGDWEAHMPEHGMLVLSPSLQQRFDLTVDEITAVRKKGILVGFWTVNAESEMRRLLEIGVDSILTDNPSKLAAILAE